MHTPRSVPPVLAALAGFAFAAVALRLEDSLHTKRRRPGDAPPGADRASDEPYSFQAARAAQPGRGRTADAPTHIPWAGWKDILWRVYEDLGKHRILLAAAGVTFYAMLAFVPAITALVSLYGLFAKASTINQHLGFIASFMPAGAYDLISDKSTRIASNNDGQLPFAFVIG